MCTSYVFQLNILQDKTITHHGYMLRVLRRETCAVITTRTYLRTSCTSFTRFLLSNTTSCHRFSEGRSKFTVYFLGVAVPDGAFPTTADDNNKQTVITSIVLIFAPYASKQSYIKYPQTYNNPSTLNDELCVQVVCKSNITSKWV